MIRRFFRQPSAAYRNHQIAFTVLTLNFVVPAFTYSLLPDQALEQFMDVNRLFGGVAYPFHESESWLWRHLAAANVMTLGFMCLLLQVNLRRFLPVLVPLTFMKGYAATSWLIAFIAHSEVPLFLAGAVLDYATCIAFVTFSTRAYRDIAGRPDSDLVPRPFFVRPS